MQIIFVVLLLILISLLKPFFITGAFLIPYFVMMMAMGLPIFYLELYLGQYTAVGPIEVFFRLAPGFYGLGYCTLMVISLIIVYYMIIVAWTLYYTFMSFNPRLGWGYCDNSYNTDGEFLPLVYLYI